MASGSTCRSSSRSTRKSYTVDYDESDPISKPQLHCACKIPASQRTSHTARNADRDYYACPKAGTEEFICKTWIWVDQVTDYVDRMINYRTRRIREDLESARREIEEKDMAIRSLKSDLSVQIQVHHDVSSELKSKIQALQGQILGLDSKVKLFRRLRENEQSALYTLFNIINFDGKKFVAEPTTEATNAFRENFLYEMMSIEDNKGKVPSIFVHTIED